MATIRQLMIRLSRLECRRKADVEFEVAEEAFSEGEFNGACDYVLRRNGVPIVRFPRRLTIDEWTARYLSNS